MSLVTPARRRGVEILDDPATAAEVRRRSMRDVETSNALFGGTRSVRRALSPLWPQVPRVATLVDVGTGRADIPSLLSRDAGRSGVSLTLIGVDVSHATLAGANPRLTHATVGDARALPLGAGCADLVTCSQLLHHFERADAIRVIAELHRVSRGWVVVSDLRRSWLAAAGFWVAAAALRFHDVTRHDGVASVFRGFTTSELEALILEATGTRPRVRRGVFWRLTAIWPKK